MTFEIIIFFSVIIQLIGVSFYIRDMLRGTTKPNLVTWSIWALAPLIGSWLEWKAGARLSIFPVFMAGFNPLLVIAVAFVIKKGYWKIKKFDVFCGALAIFALILWLITKNISISVLFAILSDALASLPTLAKSWTNPETETFTAYLGGIIANILGLVVIKNWIFPVYSLGVYFILMNTLIIAFIFRKKVLYFRNEK
ncbi:MAG: hypothetical protein P4L63_00345 [Candidatus Pacebacteria bacterium]|nr:hypothetical protein [Candidatus Paceibacterota bacterium]